MEATSCPRIGLLWGDFPWDIPPPKVGKLLSSGVVGRNVARALRSLGMMVPYTGPSHTMEDENLVSFLRSIDVLWADLYPLSARAVRLRHELDLPFQIILYAGGTLTKAAEAMLFPWQHFLRPGDNLLLTSQADIAIWHQLVDWSRLREWVVPLPVDETVFRPDITTDRATIRARHGLPLEVPLLLYVGRLNIQKNLHTLLRLLARVRQQVPDAHLCLVGETDDIKLAEFGVPNTGYVEYLHHLASELDIADAITFVEPQFGRELADLYRSGDVVVNASFYHRENFGLSQAEAQACGIPVVCSDWGGFRDVIRQGETGFLMDTVITRHGVRVDWARGARYVTLLLRNETLRRHMGQHAAVWARGEFSIPTFASRLQQTLQVPALHAGGREGPPYEPSDFARRYDAVKVAGGWYQAGANDKPLFDWKSYGLYEEMIRPYATRLARDLPLSSLAPTQAPYILWAVHVSGDVATDLDPVWQHERNLLPIERDTLLEVDGCKSLLQIADALSLSIDAVSAAVYSLYLDGLILFDRPTASACLRREPSRGRAWTAGGRAP